MKVRRWAEDGLLVAGLLALNVWLWSNAASALSQGWQSWTFDHQLRGQPATISQFLVEEKEAFAGRITSWLESRSSRQSVPSAVPSPRPAQPSVPNLSWVGRLSIPRLHLSAMVREGAGEDTLRVALGHIPGTALPGGSGNIGVAGHRDTLFRALRGIRQDDLIRFETLAGTYLYRVDATEVVTSRDVSVLRARHQSELTLVTCYPFFYVGAAPDRFIVKARQIVANPGPDTEVPGRKS